MFTAIPAYDIGHRDDLARLHNENGVGIELDRFAKGGLARGI